MSAPNRRERALATAWMLVDVPPGQYPQHVERLLAAYRQELLAPFEELRRDFEALGDERVARLLDGVIRTLEGEP